MLDIAPTELLLVAVVALVVIGPKDLPRVLRIVGQWVGRARGVARHFRSGFDEMVRQAEFEEMEKKWAEENARIMREHPPAAEPAKATDLPSEEDVAIHSFSTTDAGAVMMPLPPAIAASDLADLPPPVTPDSAVDGKSADQRP